MKDKILAHPKTSMIFACAFLAFIGCFMFPILNFSADAPRAMQWLNLIISLAAYSEVGRLFLKSLLTHQKILKAVMITEGMTILGLLFRYLMEFGEVSNVYHFTVSNVAVQLLAAGIVVCFSAFGSTEEKV